MFNNSPVSTAVFTAVHGLKISVQFVLVRSKSGVYRAHHVRVHEIFHACGRNDNFQEWIRVQLGKDFPVTISGERFPIYVRGYQISDKSGSSVILDVLRKAIKPYCSLR